MIGHFTERSHGVRKEQQLVELASRDIVGEEELLELGLRLERDEAIVVHQSELREPCLVLRVAFRLEEEGVL